MNSACNRAAVLPTCANSYSSFKPACLDPSIPWLKLEESCSGVQDLYNGAVLQPQHASDGSIYGANVMYAASEVNSPVRPPATPLRLDASSNQLLAAALDGDFGSQCHPSGLKYPVCAENYGVTCSSADALKPFSALDDLLGVCGRNVDYNHDLSVFQRLFAGNNVSSCSSKEMVVRGQAAGALSHILCTGEAKIRILRSPNLGEEGSECCNLSSHEQMHQLGAQIQLQADAMQIGDNKDPAICFANPKTPSSGDSQAPSPGTPSSTRIMLSPQILATSGVYNCGNATDLKQPNSLNVNLPATDGISSMKAMIYRAAALQPIGALIADLGSKPKRKNMKISKDPQSIAARHRRERISNKIRILQRLVPGGTKMDTASMLDEAIQYVKFLKSQVKAMESLGFSADPIFAQASASPSSSIDQCGV